MSGDYPAARQDHPQLGRARKLFGDLVYQTILYFFAAFRRGVVVGSGFPWFNAFSMAIRA